MSGNRPLGGQSPGSDCETKELFCNDGKEGSSRDSPEEAEMAAMETGEKRRCKRTRGLPDKFRRALLNCWGDEDTGHRPSKRMR
ncbi:hypothetical protein ACLOJK_032377 [Asimina triloba]